MQSTRTAVLLAAILVVAGAGSAALVGSYGIITGTATIDSALEIEQLETDSNGNVTAATLKNNASQEIDLANDVRLTVSSGEDDLTNEDPLTSGESRNITGLELGFSDASDEEILVLINGNTVFSGTIGDLDAN